MTLRLGLPSKGRLMEDAFAWFAARGIALGRAGSERDYAARSEWKGVEPVLLSAGEIPRELEAGRIHLGVTGSDLVRERIARWEERVEAMTPLGFGRADVVIAVPRCWVDVDTLDDLDAACAAFRRVHGHRLRIATKYHRLSRDFLRSHGVADYLLVDSQGATEGAVRGEAAEAIADITSTGETLRANGLKVLSDGLIHASEATLFRSLAAPWGDAETAALARLRTQLLG
jgi:ATP phosphoribosyltransferase